MSDAFYKKPISGLLLLAGAAGGPYMLYETQAGKTASGLFQSASSSMLSDSGSERLPGGMLVAAPQSDPLNPELDGASMPQPVIYSLADVMRFDITPGWVIERFPRVSTILAETQLDGLRVPLVTGTQPADIAGTLTYYFDRFQRLQRITLHGTTGDPTRFISQLQQMYQVQQEPALGGGLYTLKWNGQATSVVHVTPAAVVYAGAPYSRYAVLIELNQPGLEYGLSREAHELLQAGRSTHRW